MYVEINAAIQATKVLYDIAKANKGLTNYNELVAAVSEVNAKLIDANTAVLASQEKQSFLSERVRQLEQEIIQSKNWQAESERYQLTEIAPGRLAYTIKPGYEKGETRHLLCTNCFCNSKKSYLHLQHKNSYHELYKCQNPECGLELNVSK